MYCLATGRYCDRAGTPWGVAQSPPHRKHPINARHHLLALMHFFPPVRTFYKTLAGSQQNVKSFQYNVITSTYHVHIQNYTTLSLTNCYPKFPNAVPGITVINTASCSLWCFYISIKLYLGKVHLTKPFQSNLTN